MVEYVKSLVAQLDVQIGKVYEVSTRIGDDVYVIDDVGDESYLLAHEFEELSKPETIDANPFIETVKKFVPGYFNLEGGEEIYLTPKEGFVHIQIEEGALFTKNDIIKLAKYLNEIAEVME